MRVDTITTTEGFYALRNAWDEIARCAKPPSVFLHHAWFAAAWAWRQHDADLRILVAREGDAIVAILPLIRLRHKQLGHSLWTLLTVPDTQCCDLIANTGVAAPVASSLAHALACSRDWDVLSLDYLAADGLLATHLPRELGHLGITVTLTERGRNLYISLDGAWDRYWATRSRSVKKASNLAANRLHRAGNVRVEHIGPGAVNESECERALTATIAISKRSWKQTTGNSLDHPAPENFIRTLSAAARREGWLSVWLAYLDDKPVAMEYQLVYGGNIHALRSDFDRDLDSVSPGSFLFRYLIERLFTGGRGQYLMGPGDNPYKLRWSSDGHALCRMTAYNKTFAGRLSSVIERRVKPFVRPLRARLKLRGQTRQRDRAAASGRP